MRILFVLAICLVVFHVPHVYAQDETVIVAFGDSLFEGHGLKQPLPSLLETKLNANGYNVKVINDGIQGDTTAGGLGRVDYVMRRKPDLILLELGANDIFRRMPASEPRHNLERILARFRAANIAVLVIGQKSFRSPDQTYAAEINPIFCELALKYDYPCYPFFYEGVYGHSELFQSDGLHPNEAGIKVVLERLYPAVAGMLKK